MTWVCQEIFQEERASLRYYHFGSRSDFHIRNFQLYLATVSISLYWLEKFMVLVRKKPWYSILLLWTLFNENWQKLLICNTKIYLYILCETIFLL